MQRENLSYKESSTFIVYLSIISTLLILSTLILYKNIMCVCVCVCVCCVCVISHFYVICW